jgi:hypothetical protein
VGGILATVLDFGTVDVQTAGTRPNFVMRDVRHPNQIAGIILNLSQQQTNGVPEVQRIPSQMPVAVIDDALIDDKTTLDDIGAMPDGDPRLS